MVDQPIIRAASTALKHPHKLLKLNGLLRVAPTEPYGARFGRRGLVSQRKGSMDPVVVTKVHKISDLVAARPQNRPKNRVISWRFVC
jgi:hypothetical protein